jgi:hypothetical protein
MYSITWTNPLVSAWTVVLLFLCCLELGYRRGVSLAVAVFAGLATPLWFYAKTFFSEPLAALALTGAALWLLRGLRTGSTWQHLAAGLCLGVAVMTKPANIIAAVPLVLCLLWSLRQRGVRSAWTPIAVSGLGTSIFLVAIALYNHARFGDFTETGYGGELTGANQDWGGWTTPFWEGMAGLLVSPGRGLLWYFPGTLLCLWGIVALWRRNRPVAVLSGSLMLVYLLTYAKWYMWEGGWCWGPRFLVPALPLMLLPVAEVFARWRELGRALQSAIVALSALSILVAVSGLLVNYADYAQGLRLHYQPLRINYYIPMLWQWSDAPLLGYWGFDFDYFILRHALAMPGVVLGLQALFIAAMVTGALMLTRRARADDGRAAAPESGEAWDGALVVFVILALCCLTWPGYELLAARIEPMVFGVPFSLAWVVIWILLTFGFMALYHWRRGAGDRA